MIVEKNNTQESEILLVQMNRDVENARIAVTGVHDTADWIS